MICRNIRSSLKVHPEVWLIILFEFFQRFSNFGFQTLIFLYLKHELKLSLSASIALYHSFLSLGFITSVIFSIIADKWLSKYCTIVIAVFIILIGDGLVIIAASSVGPKGFTSIFPYIIVVSMLGFVIRSIGIGGMRDAVRSLGSDQFCLPEEGCHLLAFFQAFYYATAFGTVAGIITTPLLRMQVECFGQIYCFPLGFLIATLSLILGLAALIGGCLSLKHGEKDGSAFTETLACISTAITNRGAECGPTWLDNARVVFMDGFICDVRSTLRVLVLFLPLPFFWALFEQHGSLWIYQASRMVWPLSRTMGVYVEPDHMPATLHMVVFVALPALDSIFCTRFYCFRTALKSIMIGALLAAIAFIVAIIIEVKIDPTYVHHPMDGEAHLIFYNTRSNCPTSVTVHYTNSSPAFDMDVEVQPLGHAMISNLPVKGTQGYMLIARDMQEEYGNETCSVKAAMVYPMTLVEKTVTMIYSTFTFKNPNGVSYYMFSPSDDLPFDISKCDIQLPINCMLYSVSHTTLGARKYNTVEFQQVVTKKNLSFSLDSNHHGLPPFHMHPVAYVMRGQDEEDEFDFTLERGGVYTTFFLDKANDTSSKNSTVISPPNSVHMALQIPQLVIMALAYVLFPVTLLQFSCEQTSARMKPVLLSFWYLTIACGNLLVVALAFAVDRVLWGLVLYASLMSAAVLLLIILLCNYRVVEPTYEGDDDEDDDEDDDDDDGAGGDYAPSQRC